MLGVFYYDLNDTQRSFYHYSLSYKSIQDSTDVAMQAYIQIGLATVLAKQKKYTRAEELFQITASISKTNDLWLVESRSYYELGMLKMLQKQYAASEKQIQISYEIRKNNGAVPAMLSSMIGLVELLIAQKIYTRAETILQEALNICSKRALKTKKSKICYLFSVVYEAQEKVNLAYFYLKEHYVLEKENNKFQQKNMDKYFKLMYNLQKVQKDAEFQKRLNSELKHSNDIIILQKEKLQEGNKEKEILLKEIHHRVKNNLQIITSLLSLQSVGSAPSIQKLLNNSQHRINSMSLIHEMLYRSDKLSEVNYHDYLQELIQKLMLSFKGRNHRIQLQLKVPDIHLSIDTAIPLSLLINEIITNALKYAFTNETNN
jgi:two-component sensor histidine kinase